MNEIDPSELSKRERKAFFKDQKQQEQEKKERIAKIAKWLIVVGIVGGVLGGVGWWVKKEVYRPVLGEAVVDLGRNHIPRSEWEKFRYNSNPPTSGPHDAEWIRAGIYDEPQGDGYLVHSLEHGYVILHYNCNAGSSKFNRSADGQSVKLGTESAELSVDIWNSKECQQLKKQLADLANKKRVWKLIVVPRQNLDIVLALTAWGRIDTFDQTTGSRLTQSDSDRINHFIDAYRNHGPEQTME